MGYLLDTDICIFYLKGKYNMNDKVKKIGLEKCFISELTIAELLYGVEKSENYERHLPDIDKIKEAFTILPIFNSFEMYAKERYRLQKLGTLIPDFDLLIGVTSVVNSLKMVTNNKKHFARIEGIKIENWRLSEFNEFID